MKIVAELNQADITNGEQVVLYGVNMEIFEGDFVYIVGKVGSGKTSIIRTMIAENRLASGSGNVCGFDLGTLREKEIPFLRRSVGVIFQDFQLLMDRPVSENLRFVLKATGWKEEAEISERVDEVLKAVGMETKAHKMPHQLSGGEQQRISIARALLNSPSLILADEPTGNLDGETADEIMSLLRELNRLKKTAVVMVTHDRSIFEKYPGRVFVCEGEACEDRTSTSEAIDITI